MTIIISKDGKNAQKVSKSYFEQEDYLQKYIYDNPESIPLYDIKEDIRLLILSREFSTNSGPIDAIGVDEEGDIYLIETKLYKNPDKRLVVAQVLDYGASMWNNRDFTEFVNALESETQKKHKVSLNQKLKDYFGINDDEIMNLMENLKRNLEDGDFKFVVLMDKLDPRLKDLIFFINRNSQFSIFAVELEYYRYEDYEIMIPRLYGAETKKSMDVRGSGIRKKWDEQSFFTDASSRLTEEQLQTLRKVYDFSKKFADEMSWGTGTQKGSFNPIFTKICPRSLYTVYSTGRLNFNFLWMKDNPEMERYRDEFKEKLSKIKGVTITADYKEKSIGIPIEQWISVQNDFMQIVEDLVR